MIDLNVLNSAAGGKNVPGVFSPLEQVETAEGRFDAVIAADTIRDSLQAEALTKEVPVNQVFDFSHLPVQ